jgi:enhancing lycopene biosynthesis protein 2
MKTAKAKIQPMKSIGFRCPNDLAAVLETACRVTGANASQILTTLMERHLKSTVDDLVKERRQALAEYDRMSK